MNIDVLEERALDFALAATVSGYPSSTFHAKLAAVLDVKPASWAEPLLTRSATREGLAELQSHFLSHFEMGSARLPLHETEYGRTGGLSKGNDLADLAGFYRAYSLELSQDEGSHELYDHLAVELEFYSSLLARQALLTEAGRDEGVAVVEDTRRSFLKDHLGRLALALQAHANLAADSVWAVALAETVRLVLAECEALGVTPAPLDAMASAEPDDVQCAVNFNPAGGKAAH